MTTEPSTLISDVNTTTTEVTKKQRSVSELSMLKTYQGMTDEEIQSLIDFHVQMERDALDTKTAQANAIMQANAAAEAYASAASESVAAMKALIDKPTEFGKIDADGKKVQNG